MSEQCSGVGEWFVSGGEIFGGEKRGLLEDEATEIKKENNTKPYSVWSEVSLSESSEVCFGHREKVLALSGSSRVCGFLADWLLS